MKKVRVFELAKSFGMKGPELAKLLRSMGFSNVKTHMTALDEADEMMVLARLEAHGHKRVSPDDAAGTPAKKPLKKLPAAGDGTELEAEPEPLIKKKVKELPTKKELPAKKQLPKPTGRRSKKSLEEAAEAPVAETARAEVAAEAEQAPPATTESPATAAETAPAATVTETPTAAPESLPAAASEPEVVTPAAAAAAETVPVPPATAAESPAAAAATADTDAPAAEPATPADDQAAPAAEAPAEPTKPESQAPTTGEGEDKSADQGPVRKLLIPQKRAQVVGRIELPQETIRDATRRSAPAAERDLRRAALQKTAQRGAMRSGMPGGHRRGPGGPGRGRDGGQRGPKKARTAPTIDPSKEVEISPPVSIKSMSEALGTKVSELIATLTFKLKIPGKNINSYLTVDEVELVALELDRKVKIVEQKEAEEEMIAQLVDAAESETEHLRSPVVTFMGHVDHGKTSLLDALRDSDITKDEAGGITQHIGAYKIHSKGAHGFVVLDTPGHAAFTAMRARGANITDLVILVVAADDGVMPQTEEAINHAKAAEAKIIVAINKCDLPGANPMQVKQQLMIKGLQSEDFGGEIGMVEVSAKTGAGLDDLIERIMLESEMLDLKARPEAAGRGIVVESKQSPEQGVVVTLLVTDGTIRSRDQIVCGESFARVRAMVDDHGRQIEEAGPSTPVTLFGLDRLPTPGDKLFVVEDSKKAREVVEERQRRERERSLAERGQSLDDIQRQLAGKSIEEIKIILKADAMGSLEPLRKSLADLATDEVRVTLVHSALGGINETDVSLAEASDAIIVGFHTIADSSARQAAERAGVEIRYYDVIYHLLDEIKLAMEGKLKPDEVEKVIGQAEIRALFKSSKFGNIAGCYVTDGVARRGAKVRLTRDGNVLHTGKVETLRRETEDVKEVRTGFECGMTIDHQDIKVGDILEFSQVELVKRKLD